MIWKQQQALKKSFMNALLIEERNNHDNIIKNVINISLIICNTAMVCINSIIEDQDLLKVFIESIEYHPKFLYRFGMIPHIKF